LCLNSLEDLVFAFLTVEVTREGFMFFEGFASERMNDLGPVGVVSASSVDMLK